MNPQSQPYEPSSLPRPINPVPPAQQLMDHTAPTSLPDVNESIVSRQAPVVSQKKSVHSPEIADDIDLIEKEWVEKAKHIVSSTKEDPREQNVEIAKLKADYMKKRYNKDLEVDTE